jgi:hypothetical protein
VAAAAAASERRLDQTVMRAAMEQLEVRYTLIGPLYACASRGGHWAGERVHTPSRVRRQLH